MAGAPFRQQRGLGVDEHLAELLVELDAGDPAHPAIAVDEPAALAVEDGRFVEPVVEREVLAALAAGRRPALERAGHAVARDAGADVNDVVAREGIAPADRVGPCVERRDRIAVDGHECWATRHGHAARQQDNDCCSGRSP